MKQTLLLCLLFSTCFVHSQTVTRQSLEVTAQVRREKQADYITQFGNVSYQNALQLYGTSVGFDVSYRYSFNKWFIKPSVGYYRFTIDKIINDRIPTWFTGTSNYRPIDYRPDSIPLGYSTGNYYYNNIALGLAFGKSFILAKNLSITTDLAFTYLTTFSQHYRVGNGFKTTNNKSFGYLFDYKVGVQRELKNVVITANFILPLYKEWKQDKVFLENPSSKVEKWFGGYGFALTVGKYLR